MSCLVVWYTSQLAGGFRMNISHYMNREDCACCGGMGATLMKQKFEEVLVGQWYGLEHEAFVEIYGLIELWTWALGIPRGSGDVHI